MQVVVGDQQFLVHLPRILGLGQTVQAVQADHAAIRIQFPHQGMVVVAEQEAALDAMQHVGQLLMVSAVKGRFIEALGGHIRRVAIKKGVAPVVMGDQHLIALVFQRGVAQPVMGAPVLPADRKSVRSRVSVC